MINKSFITILVIGFIITSYWFWQTNQIKPAPEINLTTISGKKIDLVQLKGKPVIVTFWATDCKSCIEEVPHLIDLYSQYHSKGLEVIAIAMYYDPPNHVVTMAKAKKIPYDIALDLKAEHANAFGQVQLTPTTFLISPSGNIIQQITGKFEINDIRNQLNNLITG